MATNRVWEPFSGAQQRFMQCPVWECLLHGNRGGGKQIPNDSKVLCANGFKRIDELSIGELVYSRDGTLYPITGIFPQGKKRVYLLKFQDGRIAKSGNDHLWSIVNTRMTPMIKSTVEMFASGISIVKEGAEQYKYRVPNCKPIEFSGKELPLDPYILGCLISEGSLTSKTPRVATSQKYILDYFRKYFDEFEIECREKDSVNHTIVDRNPSGNPFMGVPRRKYRSNRLNNAIEFLKLDVPCKHKFIPVSYKNGSIKQRLELLQGLMDTDGTVGKKGHAEFTSASRVLINDVAYLCRSLGIRCRLDVDKRVGKVIIKGKEYNSGLTYRLYINTTEIIAKVPKKIERCTRKKITNSQTHISIVDIQRTTSHVDMTCIAVDSPDNTYIIDDFIVTHNTDVLIMDYLQGVGKGYGSDYKGLLLREATTELGDIITKTRKWIPQIFPSAKYNKQTKIWEFEGGETLWLNYARTEDDYWQYHGHEYPWIGWEELTNHPFPSIYLKLMSCSRSSNPNIQKKYRATCNPSGPGHMWVKERFINPLPIPESVFIDEFGQKRTHIKSRLSENKALMEADPSYKAKLMAMTQDDQMLRDAWVDGSWDLITGGFFTDVWDRKIHVIPNFKIPRSWKLSRSFDWGSSKPWAVTYGFECNGEQPPPIDIDLPYFTKGSMLIPTELYGWNGTINEGDQATSQQIASRVLTVDKTLITEYGARVIPGPADTSIWDVRDGTSIGSQLTRFGCNWTKAYKGSGSRIAGWAIIRQMLGAAKRQDLEAPHLYFLEQAAHHIRTLPIMQRDKKKPEDIDTDLEDHAMDSLRYLLARKLTTMKRRKVGN